MNIAIVGTGYVGLVTGTCFAEMGLRVFCVDTDAEKISNLRRGIIPLYEPGLEPLVKKNADEGRLSFHTSLAECIGDVQMLFIAVGTPAGDEGRADLRYVFAVSDEIGRLMTKPLLVITKSTVPVGTTYKVKERILSGLRARGVDVRLEMANNPEFLKEGAAVKDFMSPDRVVVGVEGEMGRELMQRLYRPFLINHFRVIFMDILSSELTKYASNAMLATRISFMNELANLAEALGADVEMIRQGMGADKRIGTSFLYPGAGYGGSCFPKDVQALSHSAREIGLEMKVIDKVHEVNDAQKHLPADKVKKHLGSDLRGRVIAVWGLSFKPETDDMREAPSLVVTEDLLRSGARVQAYDPAAVETARKVLPDGDITFADTAYDALRGADALVLLTEWKEFRMPDWGRVKTLMRGNLVVDGRNIYVPSELRETGFRYEGIGRG